MRKFKNIVIALLPLFLLSNCDRNDSLDDDVIVGQMAPHVYWEVESSTVSAGSSVPFSVQYYTTSSDSIDHLEVWYNLVEDESKVVTCPWVVSFTYSITSTKSIEKRISQEISDYVHSTSYWSDSLRAYTFKSTFPTSGTLSSVTWSKPSTFDSDKMIKYFGNDFMTNFKDSLYNLMDASDFQKMFLGLSLVENFKVYLDSTYNDNSGSWDYHFPYDSEGNAPVPAEVKAIYETIPFSDLIYDASTASYSVEYGRSYSINANIKVLDKKGVAGIGLSKQITLN